MLGRRGDGYHDLQSIMQTITLHDTLVIEPAPERGWRFFCSEPALQNHDNLVCRAARALQEYSGQDMPGAAISLYKAIPAEAGLAGGSSDAAAALKGLNLFWDLNLSFPELLKIGAALGSDIPFCLHGGTALVEGRGEKVTALPSLPGCWVVLFIPPGLGCSTAEVYGALKKEWFGRPSLDPLIEAVQSGDGDMLDCWFERGDTNTLEYPVLNAHRSLEQLKARLRSSSLAPALSGSGPTLFILTKEYGLARSAATALTREGYPVYLCRTTSGRKE